MNNLYKIIIILFISTLWIIRDQIFRLYRDLTCFFYVLLKCITILQIVKLKSYKLDTCRVKTKLKINHKKSDSKHDA